MIFLSVMFFTALFVFCNYHFGIDTLIRKNNSVWIKLFYWYLVFASSFIFPYLLFIVKEKDRISRPAGFYLLLFTAPLIFSWKISATINYNVSTDTALNDLWNQVFYWPSLAIVVTLLLGGIWLRFDKEQPFYGLTKGNFSLKPYWLMLLLMAPLITLAATQKDFLAVYPKLKMIDDSSQGWQKVLFELSYGTDFFTIELFFRGFLILAFAKWAGKNAILPMACFYCTIHFGKPMGECISSFFGGILLGIVVYNTRSIWGGLLVHLGIAWLMEAAGYIGNQLQ